MNLALLAFAFLLASLSSLVIKLACDSFEGASEHLGRIVYKMPSGVRGATIEAIGSSMPELLTTCFLLFLYHDTGGFAAGIATCAGSAVFNAVVIPALCILAVSLRSRKALEPPAQIALERKTVLRDGLFFVAAEVVLIYFLGGSRLAWWTGAILMAIYAIYFGFLMWQTHSHEENEGAAEESASPEVRSLGKKILALDWNGLLFQGRSFNATSAWTVLALATLTISVGCYALAKSVMLSAQALNVPAYFTAVILGAAATSVPDSFISVSDALKGDYDDAISNAVGSNIFDICVALGLPLTIYCLIYGELDLGVPTFDAANIQDLRIALLLITGVVLGLFLFGKREGTAVRVGKGKAYILLATYGIWTLFIVGRVMNWQWLPGQ